MAFEWLPFLPSHHESCETSPTPCYPFNSGRLLNNSQLHLSTYPKIKTETLSLMYLIFIPVFNTHLLSQFPMFLFCSFTFSLHILKWIWLKGNGIEGNHLWRQERHLDHDRTVCHPSTAKMKATPDLSEKSFLGIEQKCYIFPSGIFQAVISTRQQKRRETWDNKQERMSGFTRK